MELIIRHWSLVLAVLNIVDDRKTNHKGELPKKILFNFNLNSEHNLLCMEPVVEFV